MSYTQTFQCVAHLVQTSEYNVFLNVTAHSPDVVFLLINSKEIKIQGGMYCCV